jgi:large subunit ribosomal protein L6
MYELEIPNGVKVDVAGDTVTIKGKLGSTTKKVSQKFVIVNANGNKLTISGAKSKAVAKKSALAAKAINTELSDAIYGVENGIEKKMKVLFAHFPTSLEVKGKKLYLKNLFGEKVPREVQIVGNTTIEVKGQDVTIKGVDKYDVGQTIANIRKGCYSRGYDTRVFQDGLYVVNEE